MLLCRSSAYATLTKLCVRTPHLVRSDAALPAKLFEALEVEHLGSRSALQEAIAALADVHAIGGHARDAGGAPPPRRMCEALHKLLLRAASSPSSHTRCGRLPARATAYTKSKQHH